MEPITLAAVTSAVTVLASEVGKGMASEAGKSAWNKIKSLFKWSAEPNEADLSIAVAQALQTNEALSRQIVEILQARQAGTASALVGRIDAEKVVVADKIGILNM